MNKSIKKLKQNAIIAHSMKTKCKIYAMLCIKIKILSTAKTRRIYYKLLPDGDPVYEKEYPSVPLPGSNKNDSKVFDVMVCGNAYLESLGRRL